jgi:glycosyltransferase involved in cell wall biosynthesis
LILNGDWSASRFTARNIRAVLQRVASLNSIQKGVRLLREAGVKGVLNHLFPKPLNKRNKADAIHPAKVERVSANAAARPRKIVLRVDLPRSQVIDAFFEADLFVFASKVEYSPLVLFEAAAAGTPFLTVPAGNADEIVRWTGGGWLCPADVDDRGYVKVSPNVLAREIEKGIRAPEHLRLLGEAGRAAWRERFTWLKIAHLYERILRGESVTSFMPPEAVRTVQGA